MVDDASARTELFGYAFVLVQHLAHRADPELARLGLTTRQWLLLAVLDRFFPDRHPSLTEAAARYGSSRQNVKQIALQLEEAGFLRLAPDPVDRRATRLVRTDRAAVFSEPAAAARGRALLDEIYAGLSPADVRRLRDLIRRWVHLLETGGRRSTTNPDREAS